jgi:hypothetical protein
MCSGALVPMRMSYGHPAANRDWKHPKSATVSVPLAVQNHGVPGPRAPRTAASTRAGAS